MKKVNFFFLLAIVLLLWITPVSAQSDQTLTLRMSRTFGYSSGTGKIQGRFTLKAIGPDHLESVSFYIDGELMGVVEQSPYHLSFDTGAYALGLHTLNATGITSDGLELRSNSLQAVFVTSDESLQGALSVVAPIIGIVLIVMALSMVVTFFSMRKNKDLPLGAARSYGYAGGTICPRCQRPYPRNVLSPNMLVGKLERCPFCGKWAIVSAAPIEILRAAEQAELQNISGDVDRSGENEEVRLRRDLEDSRYQDL